MAGSEDASRKIKIRQVPTQEVFEDPGREMDRKINRWQAAGEVSRPAGPRRFLD